MLNGVAAFALFGFVVGLLEGYFTGIIRLQRDELAQQLEINEAYRSELEAQNSALYELEQTNRRMNRFLVHDLKNHVGCVLGCAGLLLKRAGENGWAQRDQDTLETVLRQAERMKGAVCDVLEQARLGTRPWIHLESAQATDVLHEARASVPLAPGEGKVGIDPVAQGDFSVTCEPRLVVRVLANLVLNAVQHNAAGVEVSIGAICRDGEAVFYCADNGKGIPRSMRHKVFEEFRSETLARELVPSYGLGLSFCRAAIEAQGGRIWFETARGVGSTFLFTVPIAAVGDSQTARARRAATSDRIETMGTSEWYTDVKAS
jgi:K+-sensing histidine kinase KdpD